MRGPLISTLRCSPSAPAASAHVCALAAGNKLTESDPKVLFAPLPVLHVTGELSTTAAARSGAPPYKCPCYKNPKRTGLNFIFPVNLRSEDPPAKWIKAGVCLLTSTEV